MERDEPDGSVRPAGLQRDHAERGADQLQLDVHEHPAFLRPDPAWGPVQAYINGSGPAPSFQYHRFWAQSDIAMAFADFGSLFPTG